MFNDFFGGRLFQGLFTLPYNEVFKSAVLNVLHDDVLEFLIMKSLERAH